MQGDRSRAATAQPQQQPPSILDQIIVRQSSGNQIESQGTFNVGVVNAEGVSALANELHHILGSMEHQTRFLTSSPNRGQESLQQPYHPIMFNTDLNVEKDPHPIQRVSLISSGNEQPLSNSIKRRQVLSRDKSKRHSTTLLDQKLNDNLLEKPDASHSAPENNSNIKQEVNKMASIPV